jgi:hypothetical protein
VRPDLNLGSRWCAHEEQIIFAVMVIVILLWRLDISCRAITTASSSLSLPTSPAITFAGVLRRSKANARVSGSVTTGGYCRKSSEKHRDALSSTAPHRVTMIKI